MIVFSFVPFLSPRGYMRRIELHCESLLTSVPVRSSLTVIAFTFLLWMSGCSRTPESRKPAPAQPSDIKVEVRDGGPIIITTSAAEFQVLPSGFVQATLLQDGKRLTLDEPEA